MNLLCGGLAMDDLEDTQPTPFGYGYWIIGIVLFALMIVCFRFILWNLPGSGAPTPTPLGTATPAIEQTAVAVATAGGDGPTQVEIAQDQDLPASARLGEVEVKYPLRMSPGSSDSVSVAIFLPVLLASIEPIDIDRVEIPPDAPPIIGKINTYNATIVITGTMRVELSSPTFQVEKLNPETQAINLTEINKPTYWVWTLVAPETVGQHILTLRIYHGQDEQPIWLRSIKIEVATPSEASFFSTAAGQVLVGGGGVILLLLTIGAIGYGLARDSFPLIGAKASYQRTLKQLYRNLGHLEEQAAMYGMDVPIKLINEIDFTREKIAEVEEQLRAIKAKEG
jgi:hypothetical protein